MRHYAAIYIRQSEKQKFGKRIGCIKWGGLAILFGLSLVVLATVHAQLPVQLNELSANGQITKSPAAEKQGKQELSAKEIEAQLREKLVAAEAQLAEIDTPETLGKGAPQAVPDSELQERRSVVSSIF